LKAVVFDLDGTLIDSVIDFKKMKCMMIEYLESVGVTTGLLNDRMLSFEITDTAAENLRRKGFTKEQIAGVLKRVSGIMNQIDLEAVDKAAVLDGVPEALKVLKAEGFKLGVMTRGCREYTEKVLRKLSLRGYFDAVAARDDVDKPKPNPEHAFHLLSLLGVSAEEVLYVGDHGSDAECAERAGLRFVLLRRPGQSNEVSGESSSQVIESVEDVVRLVGVLR
jgi:HAD superfamily hydrolase (TIGR01549 family)